MPLVAGPSPMIQVQLSALPGSGIGDSPASPVAPSQFSPSNGPGSPAASGASGLAGEPGSSPGTALGGSALLDASASDSNSPGLIALSVAPVGSLHGNADTSGPAPAEVAFASPGPGRFRVLSPGEFLVRLVTTTQVLGDDEPAIAKGALAEAPGVEAGGPALVFDEVLKRVSELAPLPSRAAGTQVTRGQASVDRQPSQEQPDTAARDNPWLIVNQTLPRQASGETTEEARGEGWLAELAWGVALAAVVSMPLVLIKRHRPGRSGPTARFGPGAAATCSRDSAEPRPGPVAPLPQMSHRGLCS